MGTIHLGDQTLNDLYVFAYWVNFTTTYVYVRTRLILRRPMRMDY